MTKKEFILKELNKSNYSDGIDTKTLASLINMSRPNLSHELNELCKEGKLCKSSGRPVLFFLADNNKKRVKSQLDLLSENNLSLKGAIEQAKAAILYPPKGMNCLILGNTGVGKSMFASLMHKYAIEMNVKSENSPFIVFNCADYSNNPQLLTSQLFGVKKGAYTGAESDKTGLIEQANGGILFLDEVHRLPPEGQEALFIFLDTGKFRRIGDSELRKSEVLIISATTENPDSSLLSTFRRRIPIIIDIPSLKERTFEERLYLIKSFFKYESIRLDKDICVSLNSLRALISYDCPNNIGQLKSDVQMLCAKAYSEFITNVKNDVRIHSGTLPPYIKEGLYKEKEHRVLWNNLMSDEVEFFKFNGANDDNLDIFENIDNSIYDFIDDKLKKLKSLEICDEDIENILEKDIAKHFRNNFPSISKEFCKKNLLSIIDQNILECFDKIIDYVTERLPIKFDNNLYTAFALHINTLVDRIHSKKIIKNPNLNKIKALYPKEFSIALEIRDILSEYIYDSIPIDEAGYITLFLISDTDLNNKSKNKVKVILIAHGESTATSMSDVANKLLGEDYVLPINAPIDVPPSKILDHLKLIINENPTSSGYLLLVDMGSLLAFADTVRNELKINIKVITLASTLHVLESARKALLGLSLDEIYNDVLMINSYLQVNKNINNKAIGTSKTLIISACLTGEGGSTAIKDFLSVNLKFNADLFEIICLSFENIDNFSKMILNYESKNQILFIVSSFQINSINITQFSMYEALNGTTLKQMQRLIDEKTTMLNIPKILNENIPNIAGIELTNDIQSFLNDIQKRLNTKFTSDNLVGLILHLAFLVERLKNNKKTILYSNKDSFIKDNFSLYNMIKESLNPLKIKYNLTNLSDDDICYIVEYLPTNKDI